MARLSPSANGADDVAAPLRFSVTAPADVERARRAARTLAGTLGFSPTDAESIVLAVSELATNLTRYAQQGEIRLSALSPPDDPGVEIESRDGGPGIADVTRALTDGFSTGGGLGGGLPGVQRLMDDLEISTSPAGTRIVARKWLSKR